MNTNEKFAPDSYAASFSAYDEFMGEVTEMEQATTWPTVPVKEMTVEAKKIAIETSESGSSEVNESAESADGETNNPAAKVICINDVPVRDIAYPSLYGRAHVSGSALGKLSADDLQFVLNKCLATSGPDEIALIVGLGGKISAVHSDSYVRLPADEVFETINSSVTKAFSAPEFHNGTLTHEILTAFYTIDDKRLQDAYRDVLEDHFKKLKPQLYVTTSNVGLSGVNIIPSFLRDDVSFIIGNPLTIDHKGDASLDKVAENANMVYSLLRKSLISFAELKSISISNPQSCFCNVAKRIGCPKKLAVLALHDYQELLDGENTSNAYDLYMALTQTIHYAKYSGEYNTVQMAGLREIIARALAIRFSDYDTMVIDWQNVKIAA